MVPHRIVWLPKECLDNIQYALRTVFQPSSSLLEILQLCHAVIVLLISVGHTADGRKKGRKLFEHIASRINSFQPPQQITHGNGPTNATNPADLDRLAENCLVAIDHEETFYTADTTFRNLDDRWEEMFSEEDSIFPDAFVRSLASFNISDHYRNFNSSRGLFRLRRLVGLPNGVLDDTRAEMVMPQPVTFVPVAPLVHTLFDGWLPRTL